LVLSACLLAAGCTLEDRGFATAADRADAASAPRDARDAARDRLDTTTTPDTSASTADGGESSAGGAGGESAPGTGGAAGGDGGVVDDAANGGGGGLSVTSIDGGGPADAAAADAIPPPSADPVAGCPADPDLALCLPFEGGLRDESPRHLAVESDELDLVPGPSGMAAALTPRSRVLVPEVPDLDAAAVTIEVSVNLPALPSRMTVIENPGQYSLVILPSGSAMCSGRGGYALATSAVTPDRWVHLLCTFDGSSIALWVDGTRRAQGPGLPLPSDRTKGTRIGWDDDPPNQFVGLIDDLRIWRAIRPPVQLTGDTRATATRARSADRR
jgi:hypothetical protein